MGTAFELTYEQEVEASPEDVWQAISTGDGLDAWFMGRNSIEQREGGIAVTEVAGVPEESTVTVWQPPTRLVTVGAEAPDGSQHTFEYDIEPRGARTAIRGLHKGFLGSEHWEAEYEGMSEGDPIYFAKLGEYLTHFRGRRATPVNVFQPGPADKAEGWATYLRAFGLDADVTEGERVTLSPEGLPTIDGVVDVRTPSFFGVRTEDAMYRFLHVDWAQIVGLGHHLFAEGLDQADVESAWTAWLQRTFPPQG